MNNNMDIDYEELSNYNMLESDEGEDNDEFSIVNPSLIDFDEEDNSNNVSNIPVRSTAIENLSLQMQLFMKCVQTTYSHQELRISHN